MQARTAVVANHYEVEVESQAIKKEGKSMICEICNKVDLDKNPGHVCVQTFDR